MKICSIKHVWGPNVWTTTDVLDAVVRVEHPDAPVALATVVERIDAALPARQAMFGPFQLADAPETSAGVICWPRLLAEVALVLQSQARPPETRYQRVVAMPEAQLFRVVIEARDPLLAEDCLRHAATIVDAAQTGKPLDLQALGEQLVERADEVCVGPSTMLIVRAAEARDIPWRRMSELSLVQLGQGARHRRIWTAETDRTPAISEAISRNKDLTKRLLEAAGVPVPRGRSVTTVSEAWETAQAVGLPVVMKPLDGNHGRGVFLNLSTREAIELAFPIALAEGRAGSPVIVEQFVPGTEYRLLVIGARLVACAQGEHLFVTGDGKQTVAELIDSQINGDARRGRSETMPNKTVDIDATVLSELAQEGVSPQTVLTDRRRILVKRIGSHGPDVTAKVHPEIAAAAVRAARAVGLDIAGIDMVAEDISLPIAAQGAKVCEVNAGPQLLIHAHPPNGPGRPVGEAIVAELFQAGETGRIPVAAVMGRHGAATAILLERMLRAAGGVPGLTCAEGKWVAGWRCSTEPHDASTAARDLLMSPEIDAAVFELNWRSLARQGLPADRWNVLALLAPAPDDRSSAPPTTADDGLPSVADAMIRAVAASGTIVVPDSERDLVELAARSGRAVIAVTATPSTASTPSAADRRVAVYDGHVVYEHDGVRAPVLSLGAAAATVAADGPVDLLALLAAVATGIGLGLPLDAIRAGLATDPRPAGLPAA